VVIIFGRMNMIPSVPAVRAAATGPSSSARFVMSDITLELAVADAPPVPHCEIAAITGREGAHARAALVALAPVTVTPRASEVSTMFAGHIQSMAEARAWYWLSDQDVDPGAVQVGMPRHAHFVPGNAVLSARTKSAIRAPTAGWSPDGWARAVTGTFAPTVVGLRSIIMSRGMFLPNALRTAATIWSGVDDWKSLRFGSRAPSTTP